MLWKSIGILAFALQILFVGAMQRKGLFRRYPFLFLFSMVMLLGSVIEWATLDMAGFANYYWSNEIVVQSMLLCAMLQFIYIALATDPARIRKVILIGLAIVVVSYALASFRQTPPASVPLDRRTTYFMTMLSRNLSFCSALLNVVLWSNLLHYRRRDFQMLMLAAGVGIFTTGKAVGHSLRMIDKTLAATGNSVVFASMLLALAIWIWASSALRPAPVVQPRMDEPAPRNTNLT